MARNRTSSTGGHPSLVDALILLIAAVAAMLFTLPVLVLALPLALAAQTVGRHRWWLLPLLLLLGLVPFVLHWIDPAAYVALQQTTGKALLDGLLHGQRSLPAMGAVRGYAQVAVPLSVPYVPLAAGALATYLTVAPLHRALRDGATPETLPETTALRSTDVADLAVEAPIDWLLPGVLGRGVLSLISAAPGVGKSVWVWVLLRAMQTPGTPFFGLRVHQPWHTRRTIWRLGRKWPFPLRILWMTEEGATFRETSKKYGIRRGLVHCVRRERVHYSSWHGLVRLIWKEAKKRRCGFIVIDPIRAWCPEVENDPKVANTVMGLVRRELLARGLGVLFIHHNTKQGGDFGVGVSGTFGLVGAVDELIELRRVTGRPRARRMICSRRFLEQEITAELDAANRYMADVDEDEELREFDERLAMEAPDDDDNPATPAVPAHLIGTLDLVRRAGAAGLSTGAVQQVSGTAKTTVLRHLEALQVSGHLLKSIEGQSFIWRATELPAPAPTASPAYTAYLASYAWEVKRLIALQRAGNCCVRCGEAPAAGDTLEVHHSPEAYALVPDEPPELLEALCSGCHRRAHAADGR